MLPSHVSARSQAPAAARHSVPAGCLASRAGHEADDPVQNECQCQLGSIFPREPYGDRPGGGTKLPHLPSRRGRPASFPHRLEAVPAGAGLGVSPDASAVRALTERIAEID